MHAHILLEQRVPVSWLVSQVDLALALLESVMVGLVLCEFCLGQVACVPIPVAFGLVPETRLEYFCVSCLGFLLRTARRRPISSTLLILLDRDWERDQDCFLGALLRILQ